MDLSSSSSAVDVDFDADTDVGVSAASVILAGILLKILSLTMVLIREQTHDND